MSAARAWRQCKDCGYSRLRLRRQAVTVVSGGAQASSTACSILVQAPLSISEPTSHCRSARARFAHSVMQTTHSAAVCIEPIVHTSSDR
eukprot:11475-Heterococcus_DN1.PRE.5